MKKAEGLNRRTFIGSSLLVTAATALKSGAQMPTTIGSKGSVGPTTVSEDALAINRKWDRSNQLAFFDPASGPVPNPGMGISAYVYSDHMHIGYTGPEWNHTQGLPPMKLDRATFDKMMELPHFDNLYIRVEWRDVQKEKGKLSLPESWQWLLEGLNKHKKSWGFRVMSISPHSMHENSFPDFLKGRFKTKPYWESDNVPGPRPKYIPTYDADYLNWWGELVSLLGDAFDKHPQLEFVDVSGYGMWGEFHNGAMYDHDRSPGYNWEPDNVEDVIDRLIRDHLRAFPLTPAVLNICASDWEAGRRAFVQGQCWARRDSFMKSFSPSEIRVAQGLAPGSAMLWETIMPMQNIADGTQHAPGKRILPQRYFDVQAHYAAVGFNPWDMIWAHEHCKELLAELGQNLGYRVRPSTIWHRRFGENAPDLVLGLRNDGCSPPPGVLTVTADYGNGNTVSIDLPSGQPTPGSMHLYALPYLGGQQMTSRQVELKLAIRLKGKTFPVRWAVASSDAGGEEVLQVPLAPI